VGSRRKARELALQLLYQHEVTGSSPEQMQADFEEWRTATDGIRQFADALLRGTLAHVPEIDQALEQQTAHWRVERLAAVDRNVLRLAIFELLFDASTPHAVIIDEAIEIAKKYGAEESARFVNGVLDGFVKRRAEVG
jgi:N utilization substance protein B